MMPEIVSKLHSSHVF